MQEYPVTITSVDGDPIRRRSTEIVERKGFGHPDTICDGIAEAISRALSRRYLEEFGRILHHNTDSVQLIAGETTTEFGGGQLHDPITIHLGGQATMHANGTTIPVNDIATTTAREYFDSHFDAVPEAFLEIDANLRETSRDLQALFEDGGVSANDTSVGVGYAPRTETEQLIKTLEPRIWSEVEQVGKDVKLAGRRRDDELHLIVAAAVRSSAVATMQEYLDVKETVRQLANRHAKAHTDLDVTVDVNVADDPANGVVYITETGLSAEAGDDGGVGRGNRVNGLITPYRRMSIEATAGKNPVSHVGKLYNVLATETAERVAQELSADYAEVLLLSEIGAPITQPDTVDVETTVRDHETVESIVRNEISRIDEISDRIVAGTVGLF